MRFAFALLFLAACTPKPGPPDSGSGPATCDVVLPTACTDAGAALRYEPDIKPIIATHCVNCHYGQVGGPWPLSSYQDVIDWVPEVRDSIADCTMPQADGGTNMTTAEKHRVLDWLRCNYPR